MDLSILASSICHPTNLLRDILTPLDYFLWGYVKDQVYADSLLSIEALKTTIRRVIGQIKM